MAQTRVGLERETDAAPDERARAVPRQVASASRPWGIHGRRRELAALRDALDEVRERRGLRVALVSGEPGIGKTRLTCELCLEAHREGISVLYGHAHEEVATPYEPFVKCLDGYYAIAPATGAEAVGPWAAPVARIVPALRRRLPALDESAEPSQYVLLDAVSALFAAQTADAPAVIVLDDLHWADAGSVALLEHLLSSPHEVNALVVGTYRATELVPDGPLARALARLSGDARLIQIELSGLEDADARALVGEITGLSGDRVGTLASSLRRDTGGNPLFLTELLRGREEDGDLMAGGAGGDGPALDLPRALTEVIRRRVRRLGPQAADVLATAALVGTEFDPELVVRASAADADVVSAALEAAESAGIAHTNGGGRMRFAHPLVARSLAEHLPGREKGAAHRRIAEALEEEGGVRPAELARHWGEARPASPSKACEHAERAAAVALASFDSTAALDWYRHALELHARADGDPEQQCRLLIGLGKAQRLAGDSSFRQTLLDAARLTQELGLTDLLVEAALANNRGFVSSSGLVDEERVALLESALAQASDLPERVGARLEAMLGLELTFSGEWDRRTKLSASALERARGCGDRHTLATVLVARLLTIWAPETLEERLATGEEAVAIADELSDPLLRFHAVHWHSIALLHAGRMAEAKRAIEREVALAERLGDPTALWIAGYDRANLAIIAGRLDAADEHADAAVQTAMESDQPDAIPFYASQLTNIRYEQGRLPELLPLIAETIADNPGIPGFRAVLALAYVEGEMADEARALLTADAGDGFAAFPLDVTWLAAHTIYAHVAAELADELAASILYERLEPWADQFVYTGVSAWGCVEHALGRLAGASNDHERAERHLEAALRSYAELEAPVWLARAQLDLARVMMARGTPDDMARSFDLLEAAETGSRRHGAAAVTRRVTAQLHRAGALRASLSPPLAAPRPRDLVDTAPADGSVAPAGELAQDDAAVLRRDGDMWRVERRGASFALRDSKGVGYLVELLRSPGQEHHAMELQNGNALPPRDGRQVDAELAGAPPSRDDAGAVLDPQAKREYRERAHALEAEIEEADRFNDPERLAHAREELDFLGRELAAAVGLGGRDRRSASAAERARVNVTRAIRKTITRIAELDPALGETLDRSVVTGTFCVYRPSRQAGPPWRVETGVEG